MHEGRILLLLVGHTWRERRHVPVDMRVALVASKCQDIKPLGWNYHGDGSSESMDATLQFHVFVLGEVSDDVGSMCRRRKERVAEQRWRFGEEADRDIVLGNDDVAVEITGDDGTDEAQSSSGVVSRVPHIGRDIERDPRVVRHAHRLHRPA